MEKPKLKAAILIISDTASKDRSTDKAGEILSNTFTSDGGDQWIIQDKQIVPDDVLAIQRQITQWCDGGEGYVNVIATTGGTGFAVKDCTPETIAPLLHRQAPGLV